MLRQFGEEVTIHGVRYFAGCKKRKSSKLTWVIIFLCASMLFMLEIIDSCRQYFSFNVQETVTYEIVPELEFPAITLCNMNFLRKSSVGRNEQARLMVAMANADASDPSTSVYKRVSIKTKNCNFKQKFRDG